MEIVLWKSDFHIHLFCVEVDAVAGAPKVIFDYLSGLARKNLFFRAVVVDADVVDEAVLDTF